MLLLAPFAALARVAVSLVRTVERAKLAVSEQERAKLAVSEQERAMRNGKLADALKNFIIMFLIAPKNIYI